MRADAEAEILAAIPVAKIVAALLARAREVAHFVLRESGAGERDDGAIVERRDQIVVRDAHPSARDLRVQRRSFFEIEHVEREVTYVQRNRLRERRFE